MKAIITDDVVRVFSEPKEESISISTLRKGEEVELGKVSRKKGVWVEFLRSGQVAGYIPGSTKIFIIKKIEMLSPTADLMDSPSEPNKVVKTYQKKDNFTAIGVEKIDGADWIKVRDDSGASGFMKGTYKIKVINEITKAGAVRLMVTGGVFAAAGVGFFVLSILQQNSSSGDSSYVMLGLVALGLFEFVQGYLQYRQASKPQDK